MGIKEYKGDPIIKENGVAVNGTEEIKKLYSYAGWNPDTKQYNPDNNNDGIPDGARPIGWCINCHRESKVDFYNKETGEGNKFYSIYEKFHDDIKNHKLDSVTVEKIGGTECQKCHY